MAELKPDDIFSGDGPLTRTKVLEIEGLGEITIHEFPAADFWQVIDTVTDEDRKPQDMDRYTAGVAIRFLKGARHEPTEDEIDKLLSRLSRSVISQIYEAGFWFDGKPEALKKSS